MKIPFYTVIGPILQKNKLYINYLCVHPAMTFAPVYVAALGVLGVVLNAFDIYRIIKCGSVLPGYIWKERLKKGKIIAPEAERDCKLISLVLSLEYYLFLLLGLLTNNPIFYMPFLALYALIISLELVIFIARIFVDGFNLQKKTLIITIFMIYNWLSVVCTFARLISYCDM
ncbi:uncharacterized protein [Euwallacea fornicatus]|uniref:uncharacterized protein n=1 Tax=Euwallacea fornicatus TaxID=995702 RepID=UPI00338EEB8F